MSSNKYYYQLAQIIGPWQEQNARVVLFPMGNDEANQNDPQEAVHARGNHPVRFRTAED